MKANHTKAQYTPTYHRLWNREFTTLILAELLLCMACYTTIPFLPYHLFANRHAGMEWPTIAMVAYVTGIFTSGLFCSWLIQRYRRNKVFCISSLLLSGIILCMSLAEELEPVEEDVQTYAITAACLASGFLFGNAKRVLSCTLLIDKAESCHRTEANYAAIWISRLTVVIGPMVALAMEQQLHDVAYYSAASATIVLAVLLVMSVKFPFRAPEEGTHLLSCDRFFLTSGWYISIVIALMAASLGIIITRHLGIGFCTSICTGFAISIITLRYASVRQGRHTSAVGNTCIIAAVLAMAVHNGILDDTLKPMLLGLGFGLTSSEQLYKLLDCCNHCQRSTAESTYFAASDGGLFLGIAAGWWINSLTAKADTVSLALMALATIICTANSLAKKKRKAYHA